MKLSTTQQDVLADLRAGQSLFWFGDNGPEISGRPRWPQKRTVRAMLAKGILRWLPAHNQTQQECGICQIVEASP